MIIIDIIKIFADGDLYVMNKIIYRDNDISNSASLYTSKETTQSVLACILEMAEKLDIEVNVRWLQPPEDKKFYMKRGDKS